MLRTAERTDPDAFTGAQAHPTRLLQVIREHNPESINELERLTGRRASNLTRTLHTLESYGIISLKQTRIGARIKIKAARKSGRAPLKPIVVADAIDLKLSF